MDPSKRNRGAPLESGHTSLNISLTHRFRAFVDGQVARGGFRTAAEYMRHLIREDERRQRQEDDLEASLLDAIERLERGDGTEVSREWVAKKKSALTRRIEQARSE